MSSTSYIATWFYKESAKDASYSIIPKPGNGGIPD